MRNSFFAHGSDEEAWISQCSLKFADDAELLALARAAGCCGLFVGVETFSQENLDAVDKGFNDGSGYFRRIAAIRARASASRRGSSSASTATT